MSGETLVDALSERAARAPQDLALVFIGEDGTQQGVSVGEFHENALAYAGALQRIGVEAGELVILVLRHSPDLLYSFWGALYVGAIPSIFPFLTEKLDRSIYGERVCQLVSHSQARVAVTYPEFKDDLRRVLGAVDCLVLSTDELSPASSDTLQVSQKRADLAHEIAFLQHSSGTTGLQKGVALSNRTVLNQIRAYGEAIALRPDDVIVSWLPLYHDMGLVAGFVMPLVVGVPLVLLSPFHWVRDPAVLFRALHEHRGTLCWLPNFAYNHCAHAIRARDLQGVDLQHWRMAINCSEPVRNDSHQLFLQKFAPVGFRESALATCYAMAENTFAVTQSAPSQAARVDWVDLAALQTAGRAAPRATTAAGATAVVSCGYPIAGTEIAIAGESGEVLDERHVGEILIRSDCMLTGYYRRADLSREAFAGDWYRSGDMGYLAGGQLYVTGRKKDLIIVGGKNIYPQDVEALAANVSGIHPGRAVAFGLPDRRLGTEGIILVCELDGHAGAAERKRIESALRQRALQLLDVTLSDVRLVERRWLLKSSSGKPARSLNRDKYLREFRS